MYKWVYMIVVIIIFTTFMDILMPNGNMKKYTKLVLGFLIMSVILTPLFKLLRKDIDIEGLSIKYESLIEANSLKNQGADTDYVTKQLEATSNLYKINLQENIEKQIYKYSDYKEASVKVEIIEDALSEDYGQIEKITLYLTNDKNKVKKIDRISLKPIEEKKDKEALNKNNKLIEKISDIYGVDTKKIEIITDG